MNRLPSSVLSLLVLCGCQTASRNETPVDIDARLASLEAARRHEVTANPRPAVIEGDRDQPRAWANRPLALGEEQFAGQSHAASEPTESLDLAMLHSITLDDIGDQPPTDEKEPATDDAAPHFDRERPLPNFFETVKRDIKHAPRDLWRDTKRVYANPVNLVILGAGLGGSIAIAESGPDDSVEDHFNKRNDGRPVHHHFKEDWRDAFGAAGNPGTHFALAGLWYLVGQQTMDDKTYEVGKTLFSALTINGITVMLGQAASYDRAPNGERGTFPSGHTSSSFVFASVMHEAYGHLVGAPLYALSTLVAMERVEDGEHYLSDVCMGAVLGTVVGHAVASGRDPEFFGWKVLPYASPGAGSGIAFAKTFE